MYVEAFIFLNETENQISYRTANELKCSFRNFSTYNSTI